MEVPLPEVQSRYNFTDPAQLARELEENINGSYTHKLTQFVNYERQRLRERFMPDYEYEVEDVDPHEQVWTASSGLIKRSLELFWDSRFEWDDIERGALELEVMKEELELELCDFRREMDTFRQTTLYLSSYILISQKIMDMHRRLREMALKIYPLFRRDLRLIRGQLEFFKFNTLIDLSREHDERIPGRLRRYLLMRRIDVIADNFAENHNASVRLVTDIWPMGNFILGWNKWLVNEAIELLELVNPDLGQEVVDLLTQTWREMINSLTLPLEFGLVFYHPNAGKVPLDLFC